MSSVAIIGAGPAGLAAAKYALANGLIPKIIEKGKHVGGLWKPDGSVWNSLRTNISKESCRFSDFAWPKGTEQFPTISEMHAYLENYAKRFQLNQYLVLESQVKEARFDGKQWKVTWLKGEGEQSESFDFLIIASGVFSKAYIPSVSGLESFEGKYTHSSQYKSPDDLKGKKVVVVGNGYSGDEVAVDVSQTAMSVTHLFRRPYWILPRVLDINGEKLPLDAVFYSRVKSKKNQAIDPQVLNQGKHKWLEGVTKQDKIHPELRIAPSTSPVFVSISDGYLEKVKEGKIQLQKTSISKIEKDSVILENGSSIQADAIVFATGYRTSLDYLNPELLKEIEFDSEDSLQPLLLHKGVFHPAMKKAAFVGMYRGPFFGVIELQAEWAIRVFARNSPEPTLEKMQRGIKKARDIRLNSERPQFPYPDYVRLADSLVKKVGIKLSDTNWWRLEAENATLNERLFHGPFYPSDYPLLRQLFS